MTAKQMMLPANRAFNSDGAPEAGAMAFLYLTGTTTPALFYEDVGLTVPLGSHLTANAAGRFTPMPYQDNTTAFRLVIEDASGTVLDDIDPFFFGFQQGVTGPQGATGPAGDVAKVTDRTALAAITGQASNATRFLAESGREGLFVWSTANNSANVTKDPQQGIYVAPASDSTGASGVWIRHPGIDNYKNIKWFGCKGNATAPGVGTDDHVALQAAINYGAATGVALYAPRGAYRNSALLTSTAPIHLFGDFVSQDSTGTATPASILGSAIYSDAGVGGLLLYYVTNLTAAGSPTIYPSAAGSVIERIQFHSAGEGVAHAGIYGVESRAICTLRDVTVRGFGDHGVHFRGSIGGSDGVVFGNVNGSMLHNVNSIGNAGAGLRISGNDANSITVVGGLYQVNTGYGIDNDSFLGCTFVNPICEGNTAGAIITRRPTAAANTYIGIDPEGGTSVLGANDTVSGGGLSEINSGQTNQFHGLVHAYDTFQVDGVATIGSSSTNAHVVNGSLNLLNGPLNVFAGNGLQLKDATNSFYAVLTNDGTNINTNGMPISAFSYKIGSTTVINSSGVIQASAVPAFAGGDITSAGGSLTLSVGTNAVTYAKFNQVAASSLVGNPTGSLANAQGITLAADHSFSGTTLQLGAFTGDVTKTAGSLATTVTKINGVALSGLATGILKNTTTTGVPSIAIAADFPTLNQNTTGSAATLTTPRTFSITGKATAAGGTFNGSADLAINVTALTVDGAITPTSCASTGLITSSSATAGIGYATGAGGAVTQLTSRTTGVTLNKICGAITLFSAAGSATWNTFTVTNSTVAATDTVEIIQKSGVNLYNVIVTAIGTGTFNVSVSAVSGTATESPVFNFIVVKAVAA